MLLVTPIAYTIIEGTKLWTLLAANSVRLYEFERPSVITTANLETLPSDRRAPHLVVKPWERRRFNAAYVFVPPPVYAIFLTAFRTLSLLE